jgi:hypothetical protein
MSPTFNVGFILPLAITINECDVDIKMKRPASGRIHKACLANRDAYFLIDPFTIFSLYYSG